MKSPATLMRFGMLFLILAFLAQRFLIPATHVSENVADGVYGLLMGLSIGFNLWSVRLKSRGVACTRLSS